MGQVGTFRGANTGISQGSIGIGYIPDTPWPGKYHGIRKPNPAETPLSWDEVMFARQHRLVK